MLPAISIFTMSKVKVATETLSSLYRTKIIGHCFNRGSEISGLDFGMLLYSILIVYISLFVRCTFECVP